MKTWELLARINNIAKDHHDPVQKVATDLFEFKQRSYLLVVDYYSRFIEIALLNGTSADTVIQHTKSIFARYGIPEVVISDNGPQFSSEAYRKFSNNYLFKHITSSPYYPRSNGEAERAVATIKSLFKKEDDPYLALLAYRSTPLQNGYSPSELLMCRKIKSLIPITREQLIPTIPDATSLRIRDKKIKERQKRNFDDHHGVRNSSQLNPEDRVWIRDQRVSAQVNTEVAPRSYEVSTSNGSIVRRNRKDLILLPLSLQENSDESSDELDQELLEVPEVDPSDSEPAVEITEPTTLATNTQPKTTELQADPPLRRSTRIRHPPQYYDSSWT